AWPPSTAEASGAAVRHPALRQDAPPRVLRPRPVDVQTASRTTKIRVWEARPSMSSTGNRLWPWIVFLAISPPQARRSGTSAARRQVIARTGDFVAEA